MKHLAIAAIAAALTLSTSVNAIAGGKLPERSTFASQTTPSAYAQLLQRFQAGEPLTKAEYTTVYYGSALQPGFSADKQYADIAEIYASGDLTKALRRCEEALATDPTNLALLFKAYAASKLSADESVKSKADGYVNRINGICDAILDSGSGVTDMSPYMVIRPTDVNEFLVKFLQPTSVNGRARVGNLDAVKVTLDGVPDEVIFYFGQF